MPDTTARPAGALRVQVETRATREAVRFLSDLVRLYLVEGLGLDPDAPGPVQVRLAIVEAVANVVRHGYVGSDPGPLRLTLERDGVHLVCTLADHARRFDPTARPAESVRLPQPSDLATSGYGLGIIDTVMDEVSHRWDPSSGNELTLKVELAGAR